MVTTHLAGMPLPPTRSLLHPYATEQLPAYSPRPSGSADPETSSVHSSAPSYVSAAPSYHSSAPPFHTRASDLPNNALATSAPLTSTQSTPAGGSSGLPSSQQYAPGFENRRGSTQSSNNRSTTNNLNTSHLRSLYNISEWVPVTEGLQARQFQNVAKRRVSEASNGASFARSMFSPLFQTISESGPSTSSYMSGAGGDVINRGLSSSPTSGGRTNPYSASSTSLHGSLYGDGNEASRPYSPPHSSENLSRTDTAQWLPMSPHEDPDLVGEAAAARFRSQRLYITYQQQENQIHESQALSRTYQYPNGQTYRYTSLIGPEDVPTTSPDQQARPSTSPLESTPEGESNPSSQPRANRGRPRAATTSEIDEALRAQESKTWDFMLSQMADWDERERSWKKFKDDMDRKMGKFGLWGYLSVSGGKGKLKKHDKNASGKKWKTRVGLTARV